MIVIFWIIYILFLFTQGFIAYQFIRTGKKVYLKSVLISNIIFALYLIADIIFKISVPYWIRILVIIILFIHNFLGYFKDQYTLSKNFDRVLHVYGTFAFALFLYTILTNLIQPTIYPKFFESLFVLLLGITAGTIFEIIEYIIDKKSPIKTQHGLKDTNVDMICNMIGSFIASITFYLIFLI